jgi:hypothetical protein
MAATEDYGYENGNGRDGEVGRGISCQQNTRRGGYQDMMVDSKRVIAVDIHHSMLSSGEARGFCVKSSTRRSRTAEREGG